MGGGLFIFREGGGGVGVLWRKYVYVSQIVGWLSYYTTLCSRDLNVLWDTKQLFLSLVEYKGFQELFIDSSD